MSKLLTRQELYGFECPPRYGPLPTPGAKHKLTSFKLTARMMGFELMPWQEYFFRIVSEIGPDGLLKYKTVILTLPRQCGKTFSLLIYMINSLLALGKDKNIVYSAQTGKDARDRLEKTFVPKLRSANLMIPFSLVHRGGVIGDLYCNKTRSRLTSYGGSDTSGHGDTSDRIIIDEAMAHKDDTIEIALRPTMRTVTDSQLLIVSAMGDDTSDYFNDKVDTGRSLMAALNEILEESQDLKEYFATLDQMSLAHMEWSAPDDADIEDPQVWIDCTPSYGYIIDLPTIKAEKEDMNEPAWRRAALNQKQKLADFNVVLRSVWIDSQVVETSPELAPYTVVALHASPERDFSSLVSVGSNGHIQLVEYANGVEFIKEIMFKMWNARHKTGLDKVVVLENSHFGGSTADELERAGVELIRISSDQYKNACGDFVENIGNNKYVVESRTRLTSAVGAGEKKISGNKWVWDEMNNDVDKTPLVAMTLGTFGVKELEENPEQSEFVFIS